MKGKITFAMLTAGFAAGAVNGFFGAGGGMVLIPLLGIFLDPEDRNLFSSSVAIILPICIVSLIQSAAGSRPDWESVLPWLPGSAIGGWCAVKWGKKIPVLWLHRGLGLVILYGGVRYLC